MNLKILFMFLVYYSIIGLVISTGGSVVFDGFTSNLSLNSTDMQDSEIDDSAGLFNSGISFGRFTGLLFLGVGFPTDTPGIFKILLATWQTLVTIFLIGFIIASIWNG